MGQWLEADLASAEVEENWNDFWKDIIMPKGYIDLEQLKKELFDYSNIMHGASEVYYHVTGGAVSKPNTDPKVVCAMSDDITTELVEEAIKEHEEES